MLPLNKKRKQRKLKNGVPSFINLEEAILKFSLIEKLK